MFCVEFYYLLFEWILKLWIIEFMYFSFWYEGDVENIGF